MVEELEDLCRRLHLSDHEKNHLRVRKERLGQSKQEAQFSILFKLLTNRAFNGEAFKRTMRNLWTSTGGVTIRDIDDNLFMAVFNTKEDLERVFVQGPWTFDKKLILMARFERDMQPTVVIFNQAAFWIRIHNLPILSMIKDIGEDIGNDIGRTLEVDVPENGIGWGRFLRIRVELDITKPLLRGKILEIEEGHPIWVEFRYEHLPTFCYRCGRIGHSSNDCIDGRRNGGDTQAYNDRYGQWLRAVPGRHGFSRSHCELGTHGEAPGVCPSWKGSMGSRRGGHHTPEGDVPEHGGREYFEEEDDANLVARILKKSLHTTLGDDPDGPKIMEVVGDLGKLTEEENTEVVVEQVRVTPNSNPQGDNGNRGQGGDIHEFEMASDGILHGIYPGEHVDLIPDAVLHVGPRTMHFTLPGAREMGETKPVVGPSTHSKW